MQPFRRIQAQCLPGIVSLMIYPVMHRLELWQSAEISLPRNRSSLIAWQSCGAGGDGAGDNSGSEAVLLRIARVASSTRPSAAQDMRSGREVLAELN